MLNIGIKGWDSEALSKLVCCLGEQTNLEEVAVLTCGRVAFE
jgi:hypothetical protein